MNTLKYKGFIGSVSFNEADGVFSGKIEGIDSLITFDGASIRELTDSFHNAVDDYLDFCKKNGIQPRKSYTGTLNIRISPATHNSIADYAAEAGITINAFIKRALEKAVEQPSAIMKPLVDGYSLPAEAPVQSLCEPVAHYGTRDVAQFWIPAEDIPLAKALAGKMGWEYMLSYPLTGIESALEEIREGKAKEYSSFGEMLKEIQADGEV